MYSLMFSGSLSRNVCICNFLQKRDVSRLSPPKESIAEGAARVGGPERAWVLTQAHKAQVARHMGEIRGRKGRKKDRIYELHVCLNSMLTSARSFGLVYCQPACLSSASLPEQIDYSISEYNLHPQVWGSSLFGGVLRKRKYRFWFFRWNNKYSIWCLNNFPEKRRSCSWSHWSDAMINIDCILSLLTENFYWQRNVYWEGSPIKRFYLYN